MSEEFAIKPGQALGPVELGMTEEQLTAALGAADARHPVEPPPFGGGRFGSTWTRPGVPSSWS